MKPTVSAILSWLLLLACSCTRTPVREGALLVMPGTEVYTDSILTAGREYRAISATEISGLWIADTLHSSLSYSSPQRMADALFAKAMNQGILPASAEEIALGIALIYPHESMEALRNMTSQGRISRPDSWPVTLGNIPAWGAAAMEVYRTTGDRDWLREAYAILSATLEADQEVSISPEGLLKGVPEHLLPASTHYPAWMTPIDEFQTSSAAANAWFFASLRAAGAMAAELGLDKKASIYEAEAAELKDRINDLFWNPRSSSYSTFRYGTYYPIPFTRPDDYAGALCILHGIATPEMGAAIVRNLPGGACTVETAIASARVRNASSLCSGIGHVWLGETSETLSDLSWPLLLIRGLFGITVTPEGLNANPLIPILFPGDKTLAGLRFGEATLNITVRGTGDKIASVHLDGQQVKRPLVPAGLSGTHELVIVLAGNTLPDIPLSTTPVSPIPPMPRLHWTADTAMRLLNPSPEVDHLVYVNGLGTRLLKGDSFTISSPSTQVIAVVPVTASDIAIAGFSPRPHICAPASARISVAATSITPRRPPLHLIRDCETASRYIELAPRHNTRLTFYVQAPREGDYFLSILYSNGSTETALRSLEVNGRREGVIVCPPVQRNSWVHTGRSSTLTVPLREGSNKLSLTWEGGTILLHTVNLLLK